MEVDCGKEGQRGPMGRRETGGVMRGLRMVLHREWVACGVLTGDGW